MTQYSSAGYWESTKYAGTFSSKAIVANNARYTSTYFLYDAFLGTADSILVFSDSILDFSGKNFPTPIASIPGSNISFAYQFDRE